MKPKRGDNVSHHRYPMFIIWFQYFSKRLFYIFMNKQRQDSLKMPLIPVHLFCLFYELA